jgi:hypothetical protein
VPSGNALVPTSAPTEGWLSPSAVPLVMAEAGEGMPRINAARTITKGTKRMSGTITVQVGKV